MSSIHGLYVIVDPAACLGRSPIEVARLALEGGAAMLQWRDKAHQGGREKGDQLPDLRTIRDLCSRHHALLIVNDHVDLALVAAADGVHLGQHDLPVTEARKLVSPEFVVGVSTNNVEEAQRAEAAGASYIAVGAVFGTASKEPERTRAASPERLAEVKVAIGLPLVAIGGINASNIGEVLAAGADAVAVISAVCGADDPRAAARALADAFQR